MKILFWILPFLFSFITGYAADYTILRYEASDYHTFSLDEVRGFLGNNFPLVQRLRCNGIEEFDPFSPAHRQNPLKNSLRIIDPETKEIFVYKRKKLFDLNGKRIRNQTHPFVTKTLEALSAFEKLRSTKKLLHQLEASYFPLYIKRGVNSFNPTKEGGRFRSGIVMGHAAVFLSTLRWSKGLEFSDVGVGGQILWNPDLVLRSIEEDGVTRILDPKVSLAHEIYHAFDSIRGFLDSGLVVGEGLPFDSLNEYRAVYFENLVRMEMGYKKRKFYGKPHVGEGEDPMKAPDLLDDDGNPIYLPSPCLEQTLSIFRKYRH